MARNGGIMSEELKYELAKELGVDHIVATQGWGEVSARNCGNLVKLAIQRAEQTVTPQNSRPY
ncbi:MAG: small, acid-soluble spore protein, alpha/beta type [Syntrophomonadaceae bacterium]|jgi:small acid-soluble spore protein F (minor alpha/beta-type SASP)|nr:small, acid-soluble spore protein, alpha/beta type [Syntrophomonadaceae bacterium]